MPSRQRRCQDSQHEYQACLLAVQTSFDVDVLFPREINYKSKHCDEETNNELLREGLPKEVHRGNYVEGAFKDVENCVHNRVHMAKH